MVEAGTVQLLRPSGEPSGEEPDALLRYGN